MSELRKGLFDTVGPAGASRGMARMTNLAARRATTWLGVCLGLCGGCWKVDSDADGGGDGDVCGPSCPAAGETQCDGDVIETCAPAEDWCLRWAQVRDCASQDSVCRDVEDEAVCVACQSGDIFANGGCDWICNDVAAPDFRLTFVDLTAPVALTNPILRNILVDSLGESPNTWLIETSAGGAFRIGVGACDPETLTDCELGGGDLEPAAGDWDYDPGTGRFLIPSDTETLNVDLLVHRPWEGGKGEDAGFPTTHFVLPLRAAFLAGTIGSNGNCVGTLQNSSEWSTDASVAAKITVPDAMIAPFSIEGAIDGTLCDFLSGLYVDGSCGESPDPSGWPNPPDTEVAGEPAWTLAGELAAIGVMIAR